MHSSGHISHLIKAFTSVALCEQNIICSRTFWAHAPLHLNRTPLQHFKKAFEKMFLFYFQKELGVGFKLSKCAKIWQEFSISQEMRDTSSTT